MVGGGVEVEEAGSPTASAGEGVGDGCPVTMGVGVGARVAVSAGVAAAVEAGKLIPAGTDVLVAEGALLAGGPD